MDPLQRLVDIEDIKQLKARYARLLDSRALPELRQLFTPDALIKSASRNYEPIALDQWFDYLANRKSSWIHHVFAPEIEITGADTARGQWRMMTIHPPHHDVPAAQQGKLLVHGCGEYEEEYSRSSDGWRIASLIWRLRRDDVFPVETLLEPA